MKKVNVGFEVFNALDIRVGTIIKAENFEGARKPAIKLWIDFGSEIGELKSSAQITHYYSATNLVGEQILAVVNFEKKQIGTFMSECLVLGVYHNDGVVLAVPKMNCSNGDKLG